MQTMDPELDQSDDEIKMVLKALRTLMNRVRRPVVRACLEEAHDDIAHLAERDIDQAGDLFPADAT
jgi:hypothetical protein